LSTPFSVAGYLAAHADLSRRIDVPMLQAGIGVVTRAFDAGRQIITCGNGGSAYAASHCVMEWNKVVTAATGRPFRGVSLCDNTGLVTAYANDVSFDRVFSGQLAALLQPGDLLIALSASGNSRNTIEAVEYADGHGAETLAIVGYDGGKLRQIAKHCVWVPSFDMQLCEDVHLMFAHMVMKALCGMGIEQ
jgi:D-sedoheptulose 7-phosphate isomerase